MLSNDSVNSTVPPPDETGVTVTDEVPVLVSLVAVIVAKPAVMPVTSPLLFTVALAELLLQVTVRPVSVLPPASLVVAVSCTVCPTCTLGVVGVTVTDATGTGVTVMAEVALFPSDVAVMVADPVPAPVTNPALIVATLALLVAQVMVRPVSALPLASLGVAVS
jgi:hypothetical protein